MLLESILKLNALLTEYQQRQKNDQKELLILEQQLQQTTSEFHVLKTYYEQYHEIWRELLSQSNNQHRQVEFQEPTLKSSGKKSLLKQQLTSSIDPIVSTINTLIASSEKEMDNLSKLLKTQPEFMISTNQPDSDQLSLDRLIDIQRNFIPKDILSPECLWIVEYWSSIEKLSRIFDQYIHLIGKLEYQLQTSIKTSSDVSCERQLSKKCIFQLENSHKRMVSGRAFLKKHKAYKKSLVFSVVNFEYIFMGIQTLINYILNSHFKAKNKYMKNNNFIIKDAFQEKNKGRIYDMHKKKMEEINQQYPKLEDQKVMKKLQEKHNLLKTVSKFYNQEAFLEKERVNQHLILKIMQPLSSHTRSQHNQSRKEQIRVHVDNKRISDENRSLANRITNLPPVIDAKKHDREYRKHLSDVVLMQKYHTTRLIEQQDKATFQAINKFTNNKFSKSKYSNLSFLQTITKQSKFIMFVIQGLDLFGAKHTSFMGKNPPTYQCQFYSDHKLLCKSKALEYEEFIDSVTGFLCHEFTTIYVVIEKIKQNEEFTIGEVIYSESYSHINVHPLKETIIVRVCDEVDGEIKKSISEEQVPVGRLQFKVLQFCQQTNVTVKLQPPTSYAINIKHSTPQPSIRDPEEMPSQQLI